MNRSKASLRLALCGLLLGLSGCYRVAVVVPNVRPAESHLTWVKGFLFGAVGGEVRADRYCQGRPVARVETVRSAGPIALSWLTLGIYTPSRALITCGDTELTGYSGYYVPPPQ